MGQTFDFGVLIGAQRYLGTGTRSTIRGMYYSVARKAVVMSNLASRVTLRCKHQSTWIGPDGLCGRGQGSRKKIPARSSGSGEETGGGGRGVLIGIGRLDGDF